MSHKNSTPRATPGSYVVGFVLATLLTLAAYFAVVNRVSDNDTTLLLIIVGLAVAQLLAQLVFFLHIGRETKPRYNLAIFSLMLLILFIVVGGSLWIMNNLNYHMMSPEIMDEHMIEESDKGY